MSGRLIMLVFAIFVYRRCIFNGQQYTIIVDPIKIIPIAFNDIFGTIIVIYYSPKMKCNYLKLIKNK